jgi:hypothetical protein
VGANGAHHDIELIHRAVARSPNTKLPNSADKICAN